MFTVVLMIIGGAVDYARWLSAKNMTANAMDTAVLAAGRALQVGKTPNEAIAVAHGYYDRNKSQILDVDIVTFSVENGDTEVLAVTNSTVKTTFLGIAGIPALNVKGHSRAILAAGANTGTHLEISLMLDTTGSMWGNKIQALKEAAADLVKIVVWKDQSEFTSRVAVVPFAPYVNVGRDQFKAVTGKNPKGKNDQRSCVMERSNSNRYTDATPNKSNGYFNRYNSGGTCNPQAPILPLTSNKQDLFDRINDLYPSGMTAGHLGTQWAWYTLSPNFANVWPQDSEPMSYSMLTQLNEYGQPLLRKIAVLMTDGEYNEWYSGSNSTTQARALCDNMKAAGLEIYTVGFEIPKGGQADTTMKLCASSPDHYYSAGNAEALKVAFRDIALKISTLRLKE